MASQYEATDPTAALQSALSVDVGNGDNHPLSNVYRHMVNGCESEALYQHYVGELRSLAGTRFGRRHRHILLAAPASNRGHQHYKVVDPEGDSPAAIAAHLRALYQLEAWRLVRSIANVRPGYAYNGRYISGGWAARGAAKWEVMRSPAGELLVSVASEELASGKQIHWARILRKLEAGKP